MNVINESENNIFQTFRLRGSFFEENSVNSFNFDFSTSGMRPAVKMGGTRVQEL